jgi:transcriptional regulator with GAF, ATPase, and Fis domain
LRDARRAFERDYILTVLQQQDWSIAGTARALGLQRPNLYRKARQLRIALKRSEAAE